MSEHGTYARYKCGCRCDECRRANATYNSRYTAAARKRNLARRTFVAGRWIAPVPESRHGRVSTYNNHGCRCLSCTIAMREDYRARRAAS